MFDTIPLQKIEGTLQNRNLKLIALHTCGFCKRAKTWLEKQDISYKLIYLDDLEPDQKNQIKQEFKDAFGKSVSYPTLIIDDSEYLPGFIEIDWRQTLKPEGGTS